MFCSRQIECSKAFRKENCLFCMDVVFYVILLSLIALHIDPRREQSIVQSISLLSISSAITRGRTDTCSDSFGRSTPPVAPVFSGTWRKRRITSSRSSPSVFMGKVKPARKCIFALSRRQTVSPPTVPTKVGGSRISLHACLYFQLCKKYSSVLFSLFR